MTSTGSSASHRAATGAAGAAPRERVSTTDGISGALLREAAKPTGLDFQRCRPYHRSRQDAKTIRVFYQPRAPPLPSSPSRFSGARACARARARAIPVVIITRAGRPLRYLRTSETQYYVKSQAIRFPGASREIQVESIILTALFR